jgi:catechol 2,3-dioxygenase-like lactoylglutathione lyase family enzyme
MQNIIPIFKSVRAAADLRFYTEVLDFKLVYAEGDLANDPAYCLLSRDGAELHISSHAGDGIPGNKAYVVVEQVDSLFKSFLSRGLDTSAHQDSPVHTGPTNQSWGNREFCVQDPSGNTLCFGQPNAGLPE